MIFSLFIVDLMMLLAAQTIWSQMKMINEWQIEKDMDGNSCSLFKVLSQHLPGETEKPRAKVRIVTVLPKI
jgi:hypothetical protein